MWILKDCITYYSYPEQIKQLEKETKHEAVIKIQKFIRKSTAKRKHRAACTIQKYAQFKIRTKCIHLLSLIEKRQNIK